MVADKILDGQLQLADMAQLFHSFPCIGIRKDVDGKKYKSAKKAIKYKCTIIFFFHFFTAQMVYGNAGKLLCEIR